MLWRKEKLLSLPGIELQFLGRQARTLVAVQTEIFRFILKKYFNLIFKQIPNLLFQLKFLSNVKVTVISFPCPASKQHLK
jgi:hypothetical protein